MKGAALWGNGMSGEMLDNTYYKQSYALITPALDVMGDLASLFCGYRERVYSPILYVGMGIPIERRFVKPFPFKRCLGYQFGSSFRCV